MKIYRDGTEIYDFVIDEKTQLSKKLMGEDYITLNITVDQKLDIQIGDYVLHNSIKYQVNRPVGETKKSEVEYEYEIQFEGPYYLLLDKMLMYNGSADFYLTGYLEDFVQLIVDNLNEIHAGWTVGTVDDSDWINEYFDSKNCKEALEQLSDDFNVEFEIKDHVINVVERVENATELTFEHGKGNGLYELSRKNVDDDNTVTRLYAFGSDRNIPSAYRSGIGRLVFENDDGTRYLENTSEYDRIVEKVVIFENIYPKFEGSVESVADDKLFFVCSAIDFNINDYLMSGIAAKVIFIDGDLMGYQFSISFDNDEKRITLETITTSGGLTLPAEDTFYPQVGDQFVFVDLKMPDSYVTNAETKLKNAAQAYLDYYSQLRVKYELTLDYRYIRNNNIILDIGDTIRIIDNDFDIDKQIRITSLTVNLDESGITAEVSNFLEETFEDEVSSQLNDALSSITEVSDNQAEQKIVQTAYKGSRIWGGTEPKRINGLTSATGIDASMYIEVDGSGFSESRKLNIDKLYSSLNANLLTVNWAARSMNVAEMYKVNGVQISSQNLSDYSVLARKDGTLQNNLNADLLDGIHGSQFLRRDIAQTVNADTGWNGSLSALNGFSAGLAGVSYLEMLNNLVAVKKNIGSDAYASGFSGNGWRIDPADNRLTVDNLTVRKEMSVYELVINQIRGTNGALWVSDSAKVAGVSGTRLTIDTGGSSTLVPFAVNDLIRCQRWTGNNIKYYVARVTAVGSNYIDVTKTDGTSNFEVGDEIVRIGNTSNAGRQGALYLTASDNNAPYLDVLDGVVSADLTGKTKVRLGKLDGITDANFGALTGYGMYAENVYLNGSASLTGAIKQAAGKWSLNADGSGRLASGNIIFDASGNVTFGSSVSLNWKSAASTAETNAKNYVASTKGIQLLSNDWTIGSGSVGIYNVNGSSSENYRVYGTGPDGQQVILWECRPDANSGADGGWNTGSVPIDKTKTYRFSVFMKTSANTGNSYLGCGANSVCSLNTTTVIGNPYFWNGDLPAQNKWYLIVGYVYPYNTTGLSYSGGIWDCETGEKVVSNVICFNWANVTTTYHRCYHFYDTTTSTRQWMWNPRIDMVDGNEPSIVNLIGIAETPTGAQTKASAAQSSAISTAASDATTKANNAKSAAISTAASDATTKANSAKSAAISTAASDATTKANNALSSAKSYTSNALGGASFPKLTKLTSTGVYTGTLTASQVNAAKVTVLGAVTGGSFNLGSGKFKVDANGYLTAIKANISGTITATSGTLGSLIMNEGGKIDLPPTWGGRSGRLDADGLHMAYSGTSFQSIEWYNHLGTYAGKIYPNSSGYLNFDSSFGVNINSNSSAASPVNIGASGIVGDITIGNTLRPVNFNGADVSNISVLNFGGYSTVALTSAVNYSLNVQSSVVVLTSIANGAAIYYIKINGSRPSFGDIVWFINATARDIDFRTPSEINGSNIRAQDNHGHTRLSNYSSLCLIFYGGYWYPHIDFGQ